MFLSNNNSKLKNKYVSNDCSFYINVIFKFFDICTLHILRFKKEHLKSKEIQQIILSDIRNFF